MKRIISRTLSPSFAVSVLALSVALSGGAVWAASRPATPSASLTCVTIKPSNLLNDWHNLPHTDGFGSVRACKDSLGFVHLNGILTGGGAFSNAFRLPRGYRPGFNRGFAVAAGVGAPTTEDVYVYATPGSRAGIVLMDGSATDLVSLDGVTFRAGG
jgi:hypothetical protein